MYNFMKEKSESYNNYKKQVLRQITLLRKNGRKALKQSYNNFNRNMLVSNGLKTFTKYPFLSFCLFFSGTFSLLYYSYKYQESKKHLKAVERRTTEKRFLRFAAMEYNGQAYMTPSGFLYSLLETNLRMGKNRRIMLTRDSLQTIRRKTPLQKDNSPTFFRSLKRNGIISYTEYLFLISLLIQPPSAFEINFKMLDTDDNEGIDKEEYLVMEKICSRKWKQGRAVHDKENVPQIRLEEMVDDELGLQRKKLEDTTLMIHFFGHDGKQILKYETFQKFILNLQREILELEFNQFSHGLPFINEIDFAKLLLRYSYLDDDYNYDNYIDRLIQRMGHRSTDNQGISFEDFENFINFLYRLDEFNLAIKYYKQLNPHFSKIDFHDAFKILSGHSLSWHLIDVVFNIFDIHNTGYIDYDDFIRVMNDRLHRGFKKHAKQKRYWKSFRSCIRRNMGKEQTIVFYRRQSWEESDN